MLISGQPVLMLHYEQIQTRTLIFWFLAAAANAKTFLHLLT